MAHFQLQREGETYDFDVAGKVFQEDADVGTWTVNDDAQIVVTTDDGPLDFDVQWAFNENNHLTIQQDGDLAAGHQRRRRMQHRLLHVLLRRVRRLNEPAREHRRHRHRSKFLVGDSFPLIVS